MDCNCGSRLARWELIDSQGIFVTFVCCACEQEVSRKYNLEYSQADIDEPIEED